MFIFKYDTVYKCMFLHLDKEWYPQSDLAKQPFTLLTLHGLDKFTQ